MIFKLNKNKPLSELTDEQLIAKYKASGKNEFVGELYNRHVHLVYGICLKYIRNKEESKDIAMMVFEKLLSHLSSSEIQSFKKWLYTITKNLCLNFLRSQNKKTDQIAEWQEYEKKAINFMEYEDFLGLNNNDSEEKLIRNAIARLKPDQRQCITLFYFENMSYKEIESKTKFTSKQVKSLLQNGKRKLKLILESAVEPGK